MKIIKPVFPFTIIPGGKAAGVPSTPEVLTERVLSSTVKPDNTDGVNTFRVPKLFTIDRKQTHVAVDTVNYGRLWYKKLKPSLTESIPFMGEMRNLKSNIDEELKEVLCFLENAECQSIAQSLLPYLYTASAPQTYIESTKVLRFWTGLANFEPQFLETSLVKRTIIGVFQFLLEDLEKRSLEYQDTLGVESWEVFLFQEAAGELLYPVSRMSWADIDEEKIKPSELA